MQVGLIPVAYTLGTTFKPATRKPLDTMLHWERWRSKQEVGRARAMKTDETEKRERLMSNFTSEEQAYFQSQRFGRLATVSEKGELHVVPVTFRYNPEQDSIDIGGHIMVQTKKYRDAVRHGRVAFVVDDVLPPGKTRMIEVRGTVEAVPEGGKEIVETYSPEMLRITPTRIISFGLSSDTIQPGQARADVSSRKVD
jgi:pyridoxamine 5'-phosphate oxidase family protein